VSDPGRPVAVVIGATRERRPPGIEAAEALLDIRYAGGPDELLEELRGAEAVFSWRSRREWLSSAWSAAGDLRWIQTASAGVDGLLFPELVASDVLVTNAAGVFDEPIAEWAIGALLAFATGLHRSIVDQQRRHWDDERHTERLAGARLTVVGPGPIGRATARRALALGVSVTLVGRRARPDDGFGRILGPESFFEALSEADVVLDALPLTETTHHLFDARAFATMKPTARFLNVGRGQTVDEAALVAALEQGRIAGAALDVFEREPLPEASPLWSMPSVIVSPHISGDVVGWERAVVARFVENARRWTSGEPLIGEIDKQAGHS
jgi:phosphoglycerate dehydrogenase-like enzyme